MLRKTIIPISIAALLLQLPFLYSFQAHAQNYQLLSGSAVLRRGNSTYTVGKGARLYESDRLTATEWVQFIGDFGLFVAQVKGVVEFTLLRRESGCSRNLISYVGTLRLTPRPPTCRRTLLQVVSFNSGGSYTFSGTNATITDGEDKTSRLLVTSGSVQTLSEGQSVTVGANYGNLIESGKPPGQPIPIDTQLTLKNLTITRHPWGATLSGTINPLNTITIGGQTIAAPNGAFTHTLNLPTPGNQILIEVSNALGQVRTYTRPPVMRKF